MATYKWRCLLCKTVQIILAPKATQTKAIAISIGHSNSAYSFELVYPSGSVIAAATIINCHPQKLKLLKKSLAIRVFNNRCNE